MLPREVKPHHHRTSVLGATCMLAFTVGGLISVFGRPLWHFAVIGATMMGLLSCSEKIQKAQSRGRMTIGRSRGLDRNDEPLVIA